MVSTIEPETREAAALGAYAPPRAARFLSLLIFSSLLALLPVAAAPYGAVEAWWAAAVNGFVFLLAALWAVEGAVSGGWVGRAHVVVLPGLALAAFAFMQSVPLSAGGPISFDPYETRITAVRLLAVALYAALLIRYAATERRLRALVYTIILVAAASALFGVARQATQRGEQGFLFLQYLQAGTGYAQFVNRNHFAYLAEAGLGLALGLVAGRGVGRQRLLIPLAFALPVWVALVLCNSRGGVLAMLCQVVFLGATFGLTRRQAERLGATPTPFARLAGSRAARALLIILMLALIVVGMAWVGGDPLAERMGSVREEAEAAGARTGPEASGRPEIWAATWEMFKGHPVAGTGLGAYWVAVSGYHRGSGRAVPQQAHNDYLELLASGGVLGFLALPAFIYLLTNRARQRLRVGTPFARAAALGATAGLFGIAVHSLVEFGLHVTANVLVAAALVAVVSAEAAGVQKTSR